MAAALVAAGGEGDVLARFYRENDGKVLRRIPSWIVPENAFLSLSNHDFTDSSNAPQRKIFDLYREKSDWNVLTYTLRCVPDLSSPEVERRVADAVACLKDSGIELLMDIDPRIMRNEFLSRWPDDHLNIRQFARVKPDADGFARFRVEEEFMRDHMCYGTVPYSGWKTGRLVAVQAVKDADVAVRRPLKAEEVACASNVVSGVVRGLAAGESLLAEVEFPLREADPCSPHLIPFTREMTLRYRKLGIGGAMRDEWGFQTPRVAMRARRAFWFSRPFAAAYARISGGRVLEKDLPLFALGVRTDETYAAATAYMRTIFERCRETEHDFYLSDKEYFGADVHVAKHPTWSTAIGPAEFFHNGLDWWAATRDWAQSDESNIVPASTGMMKKFGTPLWLNEGYGPNPRHYAETLWRYVLCGGRMVYHGIYGGKTSLACYTSPLERRHHAQADLLNPAGMRAEEIARLLPLMTRAPIDCPVAHIFGHERLVNWLDSAYGDWGEPIAHGLGGMGHYVDAYPASEIAAGTFSVDKDGYIRVGRQRYLAVSLYHLSDAERNLPPDLRAKWDEVTRSGRLATRLFTDAGPDEIAAFLDSAGAVRQTPLAETGLGGRRSNRLPPSDGVMRLTDGTVARVKGAMPDLAGDVISGTVEAGGVSVAYAARGLFAVRVENGAVTGLAAGELKRVEAPGLRIALEHPADVVLVKLADGWHGVWQTPDVSKPVPEALRPFAARWIKLRGVSIP